MKNSVRREQYEVTLSNIASEIENKLKAPIIRARVTDLELSNQYNEWIRITKHRRKGLQKMLDADHILNVDKGIKLIAPMIRDFINGIKLIVQKNPPPKV